ncbi:MAG: hypothetical protein RLZZ214_1012 [Verrucomicrobiota bacterium]|jgi:hypothetical protein
MPNARSGNTFSRNVLALIYTVPGLPAVPVAEAARTAAINAFAEAKASQPNGGKAATADKNDKRGELIAMLKILAIFMQVASNNNLALLLSTSFEAASQNRAQYPLAKLVVERIVPAMTGTMLVSLSRPKLARGCEIRVAEIGPDGAPGEFRTPFFGSNSRNVPVENLVPGALFALQGRTMGGSTGCSD